MICVECGQPVNNVHHRVHGAEETLTRCVNPCCTLWLLVCALPKDRSRWLPDHGRPHEQEYCKKVADKYVSARRQ